jgi:S1-C subfamily serine protease
LIGINTAIYSPSGSSAGIGFAVPVDTVNRLVPHLIRYGKVIRPGLGVHISDDATIRRLGLPGALILQVEKGSAADTAGLRGTRRDSQGELVLGDIIVAVETEAIKTSDDLLNALEKHNVGDTVKVTVVRGNARTTLAVLLQAVR